VPHPSVSRVRFLTFSASHRLSMYAQLPSAPSSMKTRFPLGRVADPWMELKVSGAAPFGFKGAVFDFFRFSSTLYVCPASVYSLLHGAPLSSRRVAGPWTEPKVSGAAPFGFKGAVFEFFRFSSTLYVCPASVCSLLHGAPLSSRIRTAVFLFE
jgi:hypothetical protein